MAKLYFYYSAMNAGKSTSLLQSDYNYRERGMETLLFTAGFDDRYGVGKITSRIGLQAEAIIFDEEFDFLEYMEIERGRSILSVKNYDRYLRSFSAFAEAKSFIPG